MPSSKLKTLYLLDILREKSDEKHRMSVPDMVEALEERGIKAERKGIYRDIEALSEHGENIVKTETGYYLGKRELDTSEIRILISAVQAAYFINEARTEKLITKLLSFVSEGNAEEMRRQCNMAGLKCENDEVIYAIDALSLAIALHRQVTFAYYKRDVDRRNVMQRKGTRFRVNPYALIWMMDKLYLVCNMDSRDDLTHFRLDRMQSVRVERQAWRHFSEVSEYKTRFDQADYTKKCVNMFGDKSRIVTLRCDNALASDIYDRFGKEINIANKCEKTFDAIVNASAGDGFLAWVAQWGARIEIITPVELREAMQKRLLDTQKLYEKRKDWE